MNSKSFSRGMVGVLGAILLAGSAYGQRRVFTNDDVVSAPPPAAAEPAPASAASQPAPSEPAPATPMSTSEADWRQAMQLQAHLNAVYEQIDLIVGQQTDPQQRYQWSEMLNCITSLMQTNQTRVQDLFAKLPPEQQTRERQQLQQEASEQANPPGAAGAQ